MKKRMSLATRKKISESMKKYWKQKKSKKIDLKQKLIIYFKAKYDSSRGRSHDFFVEGELTIISDKAFSKIQLQNMILDKLQSGSFIDTTGFADFYDRMQYNSIEIGIISESSSEEEKEELEVNRYGYNIET